MSKKKSCKICSDIGIIYDRNIVQGSHGELKLCSHVLELCVCGGISPYQYFDDSGEHQWCICRPYRQKLKTVNRYFSKSDIPKKFKYKFLEDFEIPKQTYKQYKSIIRDQVVKGVLQRGLYFWGGTGSGKTLLSCIVLNELMLRHSIAGKFLDLSYSYFQKIRSTFDEGSSIRGQSLDIMETYAGIPILIIDDFGVQRGTDWENEMLYNLIDKRYEENWLTIVTSNRNIEEFKGLSEGRIYSRFLEMLYPVHVNLPDYRELNKRGALI